VSFLNLEFEENDDSLGIIFNIYVFLL